MLKQEVRLMMENLTIQVQFTQKIQKPKVNCLFLQTLLVTMSRDKPQILKKVTPPTKWLISLTIVKIFSNLKG